MKSRKQQTIGIVDYYSINIRQMWRGLKQEGAAFWLLCIYFFLEYVRPQSIYPAIDFLPWAQIFIIFAVIAALAEKSLKWVKNPQSTLIILFTCVVLLSSLFAYQPGLALPKLNIVFNWLILYFLIVSIVNTERRFLIFVLLFLLVSFKMSQHGFRTFAGRGFSFSNWGVSGAPGWFQNSGEFGIQMTIFVPLSLAFIIALRKYWGRLKRLFFYLMPITGLFSIAASSSRGAQLAIAGVGVWFLLKSRMGIRALVGLAILGALIYMTIPPEQYARFSTMGSDETSIQRLAYWKFGMQIAQTNPVFGIGYENWINYCWFENPTGLGIQQKCEQAHNSFVQALAELGFPGLLITLLMVLHVFRKNRCTRQYADKHKNVFIKYMAHGLDGGMVGFLISGFFISALYYPFIWVQVSMSVVLNEIAKKMESAS